MVWFNKANSRFSWSFDNSVHPQRKRGGDQKRETIKLSYIILPIQHAREALKITQLPWSQSYAARMLHKHPQCTQQNQEPG